MRIVADLITGATGVGYQFRSDSALLGLRVTTGITNPSGSRFVAANAVRPTSATGVYWDCSTVGVNADEDFAYRDALLAGGLTTADFASSRSVPFLSVLNWVATKMLGAPSLMGQEEAEAYTTFINDWLRECWERADWPEWTLTEERFYREAWANATTYEEGEEVYYRDATGTAYYVCISVTTGNIPNVSPTKWTAFTPTPLTVSLDQPGLIPLGTVLSITGADPATTRNTPALDWIQDTSGLLIFDNRAGSSVWVNYRKRPVQFTATAFDSAETGYEAGDLVYFAGETFGCLTTTGLANILPTDAPGTWWKIDFPYVLARAVQQFAYADALAGDGQHDKALTVREQAEDALAVEWMKAEGQQGQTRHFTVLTR